MSLPFFNKIDGTFNLPPLPVHGLVPRPLVTNGFEKQTCRKSHSRMNSTGISSIEESQAFDNSNPTGSRFIPNMITSSASSSRSPSPMEASPTSPSCSQVPHIAKSLRRQSVPSASSARTPAFKLLPQPSFDPTKRPIKPTDALLVFPLPPSNDPSAPPPRKAKLLMGSDISTFLTTQGQRALANPDAPAPRCYSYRVVWDQRWGSSFMNNLTKASKNEGGDRRMSMAY